MYVLTALQLDGEEGFSAPRPLAREAQAVLHVPAGYGGHGRWLHAADDPVVRALLARCLHEVALAVGGARSTVVRHLLRAGGASPSRATHGERFVAGLFGGGGALNAFVEVIRNHPQRGVFTVASLVIRPELRGCGVAGQILEAVEHWARAEGAREVHLHVARRDAGAMAFALRSGFTDIGDAVPPAALVGAPRLARMARCLAG